MRLAELDDVQTRLHAAAFRFANPWRLDFFRETDDCLDQPQDTIAAPSNFDEGGTTMKKYILTMCVLFIAAATLPSHVIAQDKSSDADAVAAITKIENDLVKADLASDSSVYAKLLADDWTAGSSFGTWDTKQSMLADIKDTKNNKTNSESISDLKVRVHGDVAIATYTIAYDSMIKGKHRSRTVISTDTFQRQNGTWRLLAGHSSQMAK